MNVVLVNDSLCYPPTAGNRIRTLNLMLHLARRHRITYICRADADPGVTQQAAEYLADYGIEPAIVPDPAPHKHGPGFYLRLAGNLLSPLPYAIAAHNSRAVRRQLRAHLARRPVDLVQYEWLAYADSADAAVPTVVVAHNVESELWRRYVQNEPIGPARWYLRQQATKFQACERRMFAAATRVVAVTDDDARRIRDGMGVEHVSVVDNGIDSAYFAAARGLGERRAERILFLGSLDWRPNLDAVTILLQRIFPLVRASQPAARLCIVGRRPPPWLVEEARRTARVELHADVPDVRPFLASSGVMTVPLRIGGGSRLKILEALACGLPVVSTTIGAEGLRLTPGQHLTLADEPEHLAAALLEAIRHPLPARAMAERARRLVLAQYDWSVLAERLERIWVQAVAEFGFDDHRASHSVAVLRRA